MKLTVYFSKLQNVDDFTNKIRNACRRIALEIIRAAHTRNLMRRFEMCVAAGGK